MISKNKKALSLALGLAMVYAVGTMSVYASPKTEIPEKPPVYQNQEQNQNAHKEECKNPNHQNDKDCKKHHKANQNCPFDEKKPLPPKDNDQSHKKPLPDKQQDEAKKPLPKKDNTDQGH